MTLSLENKRAHILVVDDEKKTCTTLTNILRNQGHKVKVAYNFSEAMHVFQESKVDILLERDNSLPNKVIVKIGFRNIIFVPSKYNRNEFRQSYKDVFESYDLILLPLTDFRKDREQAESTSSRGEMQINQPQSPINNRLLNDYKEIFGVARQIKTRRFVTCN